MESDAIFDIHTEPVRCRDTDPQTFMWWLSQSKAAQSRMTNANRMALPEALVELTEFIKRGDYRYIWAKPPSFDATILKDAYAQYAIPVPWSHRQWRCARTITDIGGVDWKALAYQGTAHDAVDDCWKQIYAVHQAYANLGLAAVTIEAVQEYVA